MKTTRTLNFNIIKSLENKKTLKKTYKTYKRSFPSITIDARSYMYTLIIMK